MSVAWANGQYVMAAQLYVRNTDLSEEIWWLKRGPKSILCMVFLSTCDFQFTQSHINIHDFHDVLSLSFHNIHETALHRNYPIAR